MLARPFLAHANILWIPIARYFSVWGMDSHSTISNIYDISLYIRVSYINIPFVFLTHGKLFLQYLNITKCAHQNIESWSENYITTYIRNIPLYVFRNILFWELLYMFSAGYLNISLAKKKTTISDSNTLRWLIYILLIVPTVFFLELQSTGSFSTDK